MRQLLILLVLLSFKSFSQPYYTKIRAAFGTELAGVSPQFALNAEAAGAYRARSFANIQAGLGWIERTGFRGPSVSAALTYCILLNPYKRKACNPEPGYYSFESYLEGGLGAFLVDPYDRNQFISQDARQQLAVPLALGGFRLHFVTENWIYILKIRCTPSLVESKISSFAGLGLGLAWR